MIPTYLIFSEDEVMARIYETEKRTIVVFVGERLLLGKVRVFDVKNKIEVTNITKMLKTIVQVVTDLMSGE